ncbi:E3 ubiquitin-protein ligase CIP8-like [Hordeum vulgare subsp. vulgare]|uniref:RING-type domain-containing protein n=1 Tax=Hordeum vulgare subsp. vulgare TaxID=112509 RepID=A0A8I6YTV4_HORVV|nr:E3 ubiquitin-protein ligase CIP8-like [Hordeum vulgare subsp. vulgare]
MADDSDGEEFCADPFEDDSDGGDSCHYRCCYDDDDEGEWSCGAPCDDDDDASNGEEICRDPCDEAVLVDDDDEGEVEDALCHDDDDDEVESDGSLSDEDAEDEELSDEDAEGEELSDNDECEGRSGEFVDDLCDDEDKGEADGESEDFYENPSNHDEDVGPEVLCCGDGSCVSGFCLFDDSDISDSDHPASEVDEAGGFNRGREGLTQSGFDGTPSPGAFRMVVGAEDSDSDTYSTGSEYEDDYEFRNRPASRQAVEGLPEMILSEEEATCGCAVCKDVFALGQCVVFLPCKHYFHGDCIRPWLAMRSTCPVCRYQLPTDDTQSGQGQAHRLRVLLPVDRQGASQQSGDGATTGRD